MPRLQAGYDPPFDDGQMNRAERVLEELATLPKHWRDLVVSKLPETLRWYDRNRDQATVSRRLPEGWQP